MKKVLITGKDSYIGTNVKTWLEKNNNSYIVEELDVKENSWKEADFSKYDCIVHVAGIAHVSANPKLEELYYKVNRDLAIEVANKAKEEGIKQFIFMSSMIIFGKDGKIGEEKIIDLSTKTNPVDFYGKSKLEADLKIQTLNSNNFKTVIIRSPMVYGPECKGNFPKLKKLAKLSPIFPDIDNKRSMIYIDNLCEFIKIQIDKETEGVFYPQNKEYISTKDIIKIMSKTMNKKIYFTKVFNPLIKLLSTRVNIINKVFGNKIYNKELTGNFDYIVIENEESIIKSI